MTGNHRKTRAPDAGPKAIAFGTTLALHAFVVAGVLWSTIHEAPAVVVEPPIMVDIYELPKLGVERDDKLLERIVQAPQPEANTAPVNLNPVREEEEKPPEEKKPELEEKQVEQPDPEAEKKKLDDEKKRRQKQLERAMAQFDERADEDSPAGMENGYREGTSTRAAMLREESLWAAQVAARIQEQLQRPAAISPGECRSLATLIPIRLTAEGKVSNEPSIEQSSGNQFFDDAAVRALRYFTDDGRGTLPLPNAEKLGPLRKMVQREGVAVRLECKP
jgi:outer membrane biosynthesis protein TonB